METETIAAPARAGFGRMPPSLLLLLSIISIQLSAALATTLFDRLGPAGTSLLSTAVTAIVFTLLSPPRLDRRLRDHGWLILAFALVDGGMILPYLLALKYIPLGVASTIAFLGPLALAVATSRRVMHFLWTALAILGIVLLTPLTDGGLSLAGIGLALVSATAWAGFVIVAKRAGKAFPGRDGLTFSLWAASALLLPAAIAEGTMTSAGPRELVGGLGVALLGSVIPYLLEYRALQLLSARAYGILMTLEPAIGALTGALALGQTLAPRATTAIILITLAAMGITLTEGRERR